MTALVVTIDGPAGVGKSTIARLLAKELNAVFLDTGAMYRAVTLAALHNNIDLTNQQKILEMFDKTTFEFSPALEQMTVKINGSGDLTHIVGCPVCRKVVGMVGGIDSGGIVHVPDAHEAFAPG